MCEYCRNKGNRKRKFLINGRSLSLRITDNKKIEILSYEVNTEENTTNVLHSNISINYCPMCGRKLGE